MKHIIGYILLIGITFLNGQNRLNERYHTYDEIRDSLFAWDEQFGQNTEPSPFYPNSGIIYHLEELGTSTHDGFPFWGVRLSFDADVKEDQPRTLILGQCHAEEILGVEISMKLISMFLHPEDYQEWAYNLAGLLYFSEIWIVPTHNPEGLRVVHGYEENGNWIQDESYRKNKRDVNYNGIFDYVVGVGNDSDGVDLNRNYNFNWIFGDGPYEYDNGSASYQSHYDYYKGEAPFSESEAQVIRDLAIRENFLLSIAYHSSRSGNVSEKVIFSWLWEDEKPAPDLEVISELGTEIADKIIREDGGGGYLPVAHGTKKGNAHDWFYSQTGTFQYLIEVGTQNMQPDDVSVIDGIVDKNLNGAFYMLNRSIGYTSGDLGAPANQVSGIVTDAMSGNPIINAQVRILEMDGGMLKPRLTDEFGRYRRLLSNGTYHVEFKAEGYETYTESVNSSSGSISNRDIELQPRNEYIFDLNVHLPENYESQVNVEFSSQLNNYTFSLNSGLNSIPLLADDYDVKIYGDGLFSKIFSYGLDQNSLIQITMDYAQTLIEDDFTNLENWQIINGDWVNHSGKLDSQTNMIYNEGAEGLIRYIGELNINDNLDLNLIIELKNEFEWEHDFGFLDFDSTNNFPEYFIENHHWQNHQLEIPITANMNQLLIGISADSTVQYRGMEIDNLKLIGQQSFVESISSQNSIPVDFKINNIYPNPFNPSTTISFEVPISADIKLEIINLLGQKIETVFEDFVETGQHQIKWQPGEISNGFYIVRINYDDKIIHSQKVLFLK